MIEINLLSGAEKRRPRRRGTVPGLPKLPAFRGDPWLAGLGAVGLLTVLFTAFVFWRTGSARAELEARLEQAVDDSTRFASTIALVENLRARQDTVVQRVGVIQSVDGRRYVWPHLVDEISRAVPEYTWLTRLTSSEAPGPAADTTGADTAAAPPPAFSLEGAAGSTQALTRLMKNLELSPFIRDVVLVTSQQVSEEGRSFQRFTLEARYEQPDSSLIETIPVLTVR